MTVQAGRRVPGPPGAHPSRVGAGRRGGRAACGTAPLPPRSPLLRVHAVPSTSAHTPPRRRDRLRRRRACCSRSQ